jgi:hypothetical protein
MNPYSTRLLINREEQNKAIHPDKRGKKKLSTTTSTIIG